MLDLLRYISKDTEDYELYDPRVHGLRGGVEGGMSSRRGPILVNRPTKNTRTKQEVGKLSPSPM